MTHFVWTDHDLGSGLIWHDYYNYVRAPDWTEDVYSQVGTTSPFQWVLLTERDYIVPFNEVQHPFSELF